METLISRLKCGARDRDLWAVAAMLWLVSLVRVALGLLHHEVFGVEATAAFLCVVSLPWLFIVRNEAVLRGKANPPTRTTRGRSSKVAGRQEQL